MDLFLHWQSNLRVLLVNCNTHIVNFVAAFWIIIIIKYTKSQHQAWSSAFCFVHCCFFLFHVVEFKNYTKCPALRMNRTCSFKAIFPNIAKVFMGVFVYWEISSLINVSSKFLQVRKCWESERFVLKKKKPALILVLRSLSKCESEFYCQHQTT